MRLGGAVALAALALAAAGSSSQAQNAPGAAPPPPIRLLALTPTVYWSPVFSNVGVIVGDSGVIVFDTGNSIPRAKELLATIAKLTRKPVDTVILSHSDGDHVDGLGAFPPGIRIIAQANNAKVLRAAVAAGKGAVPADRLPNHLVEDREDTVIDGVQVQLLHWGPAHTDGDLALYLPEQKVVFAGDILCLDQARAFVKPEQGGSTAGWVRSARGVLALKADYIVPGHGEVQTEASARKSIETSVAERNQVLALKAKGQSLAQIEAVVNEPPKSPTAPPHWEPFAQVVYDEPDAKK